jgi:hypothetical protein
MPLRRAGAFAPFIALFMIWPRQSGFGLVGSFRFEASKPMAGRWGRSGNDFTIIWAGQPWTLRAGGDRPGLYRESVGPLLGLEGIAARGRRDCKALGRASLIGTEERLGRVEATYLPLGWGELTVRASWAPADAEAIDLEVEVKARSVGQLKAVEILTVNQVGREQPRERAWRVWPRDARCASLTYDGREPDLSGFTTVPPGPLSVHPPWLAPCDACPGWSYLALAHPDDVSRRLTDGPIIVRDALFGHDLERGVVLRGRLRGVWLPAPVALEAAQAQFERFLAQPLPLAT